ncbi:MAG: hypothetical protein JWO19_203 [Bryobacterales bacterium]|jgi:hypothetical protein|nr:hypothetical protein [Bryobacterales bacterium]
MTTDGVAVGPIGLPRLAREEESVAFALMISFVVIVTAVLGQDSQQRTFAEEDNSG